MRAKLLAAAGLALATLAGTAQAGFIVTATRAPATGNGVPAGYEVVKFFAYNDQQGGTGTQLQSVDAIMKVLPAGTQASFLLDFEDTDGDGTNDANIIGANGSKGVFAIGNPAGSYIRIGGAATFGTTFTPAGSSSDPELTGSPTTVPLPENNPTLQNVKSIRVAGANTTAPVGAIAGTGGVAGAGAQFAAAVVPVGTTVNFAGFIAGKTGPANLTFDVTSAIPEPATVGLLGLGAVGLLARRRRNA